MTLRVQREPTMNFKTFGALYLNNVWFCWTLEDALRPLSEKVPGATAIPPGAYQVRMSMSNRFKVVLPEVLAVPGFSGVRIHAGNTIEDTEGCLLVGRARGAAGVLESRAALTPLLERMTSADALSLVVVNPPDLT
jgi:hypothetical protein